MEDIQVAIVEDDPVIRTSLSELIESADGYTCIAAYESGEDAVSALDGPAPQVMLMDINLPRMSGIECTLQIKERWPQTQVLILTVYEDSEHIYDALRAGASGYLLKRSEPEELLNAIRDILEGGAPMNSQIARQVVQYFRHSSPRFDASVRLTKREEEVLSYLAEGYLDKEIADKLGISKPTVRTHLSHIYEKLHVQSRTEAVIKYLK